jgi:hypothetical protein
MRAIRDIVFPTFKDDQVAAGKEFFEHIKSLATTGAVTTIVDVGCGTGEVLDSVRRHMSKEFKTLRLSFLGIDCCKEEIAEARKTYRNCTFEVHVGESFDTLEGIDWDHALVMCTGHTLPHFQPFEAFFRAVNQRQPAFLLIDFYHSWDHAVQTVRTDSRNVHREPRMITKKGDCYILTTKLDARDHTRVVRGIELLRATTRNFTMVFETNQALRSHKEIVGRLEADGYIPETTFRYDGGYGRMNASLFSRVSAKRRQMNAEYARFLAPFAREVFKDETISRAMAVFDMTVIASILPFDSRHTFAQYVSILSAAPAPADLMYLGRPGTIQTYYPTAYGLYMAVLAPVSSSTVIPVTELDNASYTPKDKRFRTVKELPFFDASRKSPLPPGRDVDHDNISYFVVPFYFADLPLFCAVLTFTESSLPSATTSHEVYSALLDNFASLVRQKLISSVNRALISPLYKSVATDAVKHGSATSVALDDLTAAVHDARSKRWKSWLLTIPSRSIKELSLVIEEGKVLDDMLAQARATLLSSIFDLVANWFLRGNFFSDNDGKLGPHDKFCPNVHKDRLTRMLMDLNCKRPGDLLNLSRFEGVMPSQKELSWLSGKLEFFLRENSDGVAAQEADEAFRDVKSVFCRTLMNTGSFRFDSRRILSLCSIYHPEALLAPPKRYETNAVPLSPDPTECIIQVLRVLHDDTVKKISLERQQSPSLLSNEILLDFTLTFLLNNPIWIGEDGCDCKMLIDALAAFDCNQDYKARRSLDTIVVGFRLRAKEITVVEKGAKHSKYASLFWERAHNRIRLISGTDKAT